MISTNAKPFGGKSFPASLHAQRCLIGVLAIGLAIGSIALVALSAPWQIRFPIVAACALFNPAVSALRLRRELTFVECLVYGIGLNVSLQMLVGLALVMWHVWMPIVGALGLFVVAIATGFKLLFSARE
jgi:hypothetical protein